MMPVKDRTFIMGNLAGDTIEKPEHSEFLNDFYLSKYEITNEQFCHFLNIYDTSWVKGGQYKGKSFKIKIG